MKFLKSVDSGLAKVESAIVVLFLAVMVLMAFLQVLLRNFFNTGILWADPFLRNLVLWVGFLGAMLATRQDRHIRIDVLTRFLPPSFKRLSNILTHLFSAVVCFFLVLASVSFVIDEKQFGEKISFFTDLPIWYVQLIIPVGFVVMMFRFAIRGLGEILGVVQGAQPEEEKPS